MPCCSAIRVEHCLKGSHVLVCGLMHGDVRDAELSCRTAQGDVLNVMGAIFVSAMFLGTSNSSTVQPVFAIERSVMYRCTPHQRLIALWASSNIPGQWLVPQAFSCSLCCLRQVHMDHAEGSTWSEGC